jgi:AcrR family transcriptional regulator
MKETKNKNALRSVRMLEEAFIELLTEKPVEKITVSDVARRADLNRGTFYAHFDDINDLENSLMDGLFERLTVLLNQVMDVSFLESPRQMLDRIGDFLEENRQIISRLMSASSLLPFITTMETRLREQVVTQLVEKYPEASPTVFFVADYISGGVLHAYEAWLKGSYSPDITISEVNDQLEALVISTGKVLDT